jgi:hypothetical protein
MTSRRKLFRVTFADTRDMRIDLKARSPAEAIRMAERLYLQSDPLDKRFVHLCGDVFHDSDAEEVQS